MIELDGMKANLRGQSEPTGLGEFIVADPEIPGGEPVFHGTRVPVATLFEHLESNRPPDGFLGNFPSVNRAAAVAALAGRRE
jgi:uncharacterized protein (DUF433 family)